MLDGDMEGIVRRKISGLDRVLAVGGFRDRSDHLVELFATDLDDLRGTSTPPRSALSCLRARWMDAIVCPPLTICSPARLTIPTDPDPVVTVSISSTVATMPLL